MKKIFLGLTLGALLGAAALGLAACEKNEAHEHVYGEWKVMTEPTCTIAGVETATCTICGKKDSRPIEKLGHDFGGEPIRSTPAGCEEDGEIVYECRNGCGETKTEYIPSTGHDYTGEETLIPATCTEKGERRIACKNGCGKSKVTVLNVLGHEYGEKKVTREATCDEPGTLTAECTRCHEPVTEEIPALGHKFSGDFTVDTPSTVSEDGEKSKHCLRAGCDARADVEKIPKGENVEYTVKVKRTNGEYYAFPDELHVVLTDKAGNRAGRYSFSGGLSTFTAKGEDMEVTVEGLREGFRQRGEVSLGRTAVDITVEVEGHVVENAEERNPSKSIKVGDAMYDFTVRDVNTSAGEQKKLSELLQGKKGAYLFFFYVGCGACAQQFPAFVEVYNSFGSLKDDLLAIMINVYPTTRPGQSEADMRNYKSSKKYPSEVYMTSGSVGAMNVYTWVPGANGGVPFSYFLDAEGVVDEIVPPNTVSALKKQYREVLTRYLGSPEEESGDRKAVATERIVFDEDKRAKTDRAAMIADRKIKNSKSVEERTNG